ncbi:MAG: hypothetical protein OFPI_05350 [Osedax symbiont Rs2]|nr:MAG: hypothetical protein OFPI_05350 [Osedax symbiont Rs2]
MRNIFSRLLLIIAVVFSTNVLAAPQTGRIESIDQQAREFNLGAARYRVPLQIPVKILGLASEQVQFSTLVNGLQVQVRYVGSSTEIRSVIEITLVPE